MSNLLKNRIHAIHIWYMRFQAMAVECHRLIKASKKFIELFNISVHENTEDMRSVYSFVVEVDIHKMAVLVAMDKAALYRFDWEKHHIVGDLKWCFRKFFVERQKVTGQMPKVTRKLKIFY